MKENRQIRTDVFYDYVQANRDIFEAENGTRLSEAWVLYKAYCEESGVPIRMSRSTFREELKSYFEKFEGRANFNGVEARNVYLGFSPPTSVIET